MNFSALTPLPAPSAPSGQNLVRVTASGSSAPLPQQVSAALASFTTSFENLKKGQDAPALLVATSGSTGTPKQILLPASALAASARGTETFTQTQQAQWLLALPLAYVAGAQVLARSALAGTSPVITASIREGSPFTPADFVDSTSRLTSSQRLTSLVPTQLHKLLETPDATLRAEVLEALRGFSGILLGGAPASQALLAQAQQAGMRVFPTYGSAETAGGCVYAGAPLTGVRVQVEAEPGCTGPIWLGGPTLALGYVGDPARTAAHFFVDGQGTRWYRTDDLGQLDAAGHLSVQGRADDVVISGGLKTSTAALAQVLEGHPLVREALVFGLPDARWGQVLAAAVTLVPGGEKGKHQALAQELATLCREKLGAASSPKLVEVFEDFPTLATGKPDRRAVQALLAGAWAHQN